MTEGAINKVLYNVDQRADTTDAEKKTARDNIGAIGAEDIPEIVDDRYKLLQSPLLQTFAANAVIDRFEQDAQGVAKIHCSYLTVATDSADGLMSASDKAKLNTVSYNAEQNVQADWDETDPSSDAYIRNKPSQSVQVQSDWDETNTTLPSFIRNKPTIPSGNQLLPPATSADEDKVLAVDENGDPEWRDAGEGLMAVAHDNTLTGDGTNGSPLSVNTNNIQEKLTPGTGITITGNTISAAAALTAGNGVQIHNDVVSARVDGTSIDFDQAGNLSVKSPLVLNGQGTQTVVGGNGMSVENTTTHASTTINYGGVTLSDGTNSDTFGLDDLQKLNGIQAGAEANVQSDWNQSNSSADDFIKNKPDLSAFATKDELDDGLDTKQDTLTPGTGITITNNVISATVDPQVQADWAQSDSSAVDFIKNKPQNLVQDANYVHTDNNFTNADKSKLDNIQAGAEVNVQANWNETDSTSDSYIQNKPANLVQDANYVHTDNNFTTSEKTKLAAIQAGAEQNVQSDWDQTDTSADDFIKNKPTIPVVPPLKELVAGSGVTLVESDYAVTISTAAGTVVDANYVHTDNNFTTTLKNKLSGIASGAEVNVQSDWNVTNTSSDAYIQNKPSIPGIVSTTMSVPPVDTDITTLRIFTDGRVQGNSSNIGCIAPVPAQADSGKVLVAYWAGSPAIGTARWETLVLPTVVDYLAGTGLTSTTDLHTGDVTFEWKYTVGRNLHINQNNAIQTNLPGGLYDAPASQSNKFERLTGADFAGAYRLACRHNTSDTYELAIAYTASGSSSTISFIGTETIIALDNTVTTKQAVYLGESCYYTPTVKFGGVTSTAFDPTRHKAIIYDGIGQIGPTSDCKIVIYSDANSNVKIAFTAIEVGKVGSTT